MARQTRKAKHKTQPRKAASNIKPLLDLVPVELLTKIFAFVKDAYENQFSGPKRAGWIVVSHVCQHWRVVALACGTLWNTIHSGDPNVAEWLVRAGETALYVNLNLDTVADEAVLIIILPKLAQIRSFSIRIPYSMNPNMHRRIWGHLRVLASFQAPILESFELEDGKPAPNLYIPFFANHSPALRQFRLQGCAPALSSSFIEDLTTLDILNSSPPLNKFELIARLGQMPDLECLRLCNVIVPTEQPLDAMPNALVARLSSLKEFTFMGVSFNNDLNFLSHLSFDIQTPITFASSMTTPDLSALSRFIDVYDQILRDPIKFQMMVVKWSDRTLRIDASDILPLGPMPILSLELTGPWEEDIFPMSWSEDLLRLPVEALQSLELDCEIGRTAWASLSQRCQLLGYISVARGAAYEFIYYLLNDYEAFQSRHTEDVYDYDEPKAELTDKEKIDELIQMTSWKPFTALETLEIVDMDFEGRQPLVKSLQMALQAQDMFNDDFIGDLIITECHNFDTQMLEELREVVNVRWNGVEYRGSDEEEYEDTF